MGSERKRYIVAVSAVAVLATLWSAAGSVSGQAGTQTPAPYKAPRTVNGQPDLSGFWQAVNEANWDVEEHGAAPAPVPAIVGAYLAEPPGLSVVEGGTIPYKPAALAIKKKNFENRLKPDPLDQDIADPESKCYQGGVPRGNYLPYPFQIIQSGDTVLMAYEYAGTPRMIYSDQDKVVTQSPLFYGQDTWMGHAVGHWEGDTLVVETKGFSASQWLDRAGNFIGQDATVVERYTPISPYHLSYEATITDPDTFTRPWKLKMTLYRRMDPKMELLEFQCVPFTEDYIYGKLEKKPAVKK